MENHRAKKSFDALSQVHPGTFMMNVVRSLKQTVHATKLKIDSFVFFR